MNPGHQGGFADQHGVGDARLTPSIAPPAANLPCAVYPAAMFIGEVDTDKADSAGIGTRIIIEVVAIVTGLALLHPAVAAIFAPTISRTPIANDLIAIITFFDPFMETSIATAGDLASVGTFIGGDLIAIITGLTTVETGVPAGLLETKT